MKNKISFFLMLLPFLLFSQEKQPKVGLVLSGGGAKGFAHIGILKAIDKAGLQLDYIGGTSMGAIIGGLYAAGYSGNQIEQILTDIDFTTALSDRLPRNYKPFFEKEYGEKTVITLPVKKTGISLPRAISKGQNVLNILLELVGSTGKNADFSKLPIPFFCIATDVETGNPVLLENGSLPLALRASSSFPTLLNPVTINNTLLIDGGVANNFPVSIMKSKGMDILIGVDVEGQLFEKEKLNSAIAILNQIVSYQMYSKSKVEIDQLDIYIHPDIYKYNVVDFDKKEILLKKGIEEGEKFSAVFKEIANKQPHKKQRKELELDTYRYAISTIKTKGIKEHTRAYVLGKLKIREGDTLSRKEITKRIHLLSSTKNYNRIEYHLSKDKKNGYQLHFNLIESKKNANLKLGVHYDLLYKSSILVNYNQKHLLIKNDKLSFDMILGDNLRYNLNYFVDNGFYISYGFRSRYNHFRTNTAFNPIVTEFLSVNNISLEYSDFTNQFFFQTTFNRKFALGFGAEHKLVTTTTETITGVNNIPTTFDDSSYFNLFGYLKLDTYDQKHFATKGHLLDLNFKWYLASSDYNKDFKSYGQASGTYGLATTLWDKLTFQMTSEAGFSLNEPESEVFDFYLGGYNKNYINTFVSFYGYDFAELSNSSFLKSEFTLRYQFTEKHYLSFIANYARLEENVFRDIDLFDDIKSGYAIGYSYNTFLGPIELKYSWSPDTNENYLLFNLGFWF